MIDRVRQLNYALKSDTASRVLALTHCAIAYFAPHTMRNSP